MSEPVLRILIADDHTIVRKGLASLLSTPRFHIEVVGEAADGVEAVEMARRLLPDLVLMDLVMPRLDGIGATREILRENGVVRVLVLTSAQAGEKALEAIRAGARGYLMKDSSPDDLVHAIRSVARGQTLLPPEALAQLAGDAPVPPGAPHEALTEREATILSRLARGMSNKEIAADLQISAHTVRSHVRIIFEKIGVSNRTQAALYAIEHDLVER